MNIWWKSSDGWILRKTESYSKQCADNIGGRLNLLFTHLSCVAGWSALCVRILDNGWSRFATFSVCRILACPVLGPSWQPLFEVFNHCNMIIATQGNSGNAPNSLNKQTNTTIKQTTNLNLLENQKHHFDRNFHFWQSQCACMLPKFAPFPCSKITSPKEWTKAMHGTAKYRV